MNTDNNLSNVDRHIQAVERYYNDPSHCKECGTLIDIKCGETPSHAKKRVFCSTECYSKNRSKSMIDNHIRKNSVKAHRHCVNCGNELKKGQAKYCSQKCQKEFQTSLFIDKWRSGLIDGVIGKYGLSSVIKKYIRKKYNNQCAICSWHEVNPATGNSPLEIHHIDGDYRNNTEDNLVLLCPNCHSLTENYKALNKNGREDRKIYAN